MTDPSNLAPSGPGLPDASSRPPDVAVLQLRLPTFVRKNPNVWFAQVEAVFASPRRLLGFATCFATCLLRWLMKWQTSSVHFERCSVPAAQAEYSGPNHGVRERAPPAPAHPRRPWRSPPFPTLNTMRQLVGAGNVDSNGALLKELFLQRLPQSTRIVLAAAGDLTSTAPPSLLIEFTTRLLPPSPLASTADLSACPA
ncbi:hypothetical protein HPB48_019425 [Haemaphysalis longicornis]|uniref:Uncharacterized protein n=1 Tax=Haemaphysalis longicornis TaxID=44386 RepID=A0A9J6FYM4_HAELO|nr:hypothetical protein HPB48_019425 [Haemaphysalis longicornis]